MTNTHKYLIASVALGLLVILLLIARSRDQKVLYEECIADKVARYDCINKVYYHR